MSAPLARGIIIAASVLVAAGIAIYENEQIRLWLEERRRRIAVALYNMGDGIHPDAAPQSDADRAAMMELNRQRRLDIVRRNRMELVRRARAEGVSVDFDELRSIDVEMASPTRRTTGSSFDDFVGSDGKVKEDIKSKSSNQDTAASASALQSSSDVGLRQRGTGARGFAAGSSLANPFDDEAQLLFDQELIAPTRSELRSAAQDAASQAETATIRSMTPRPASSVPTLIDIPVFATEDVPEPQYKTDDELEAEIEEAIRRSLLDMPSTSTLVPVSVPDHSREWSLEDSLYAPPTPRALQEPLTPIRLEMSQISSPVPPLSRSITASSPASSFRSATMSVPEFSLPAPFDSVLMDVEPAEPHTPTEDGFSTISSEMGEIDEISSVGTAPLEVPSHSSNNIDAMDVDAHSEAGTSEFSVVGGTSTPGSWTDVDTDNEEEARNGVAVSQHRGSRGLEQ